LEKKDEEKLGPWGLEHCSFGYLVGLLGRREIIVFFRTKSYRLKILGSIFLRLYSWSVGLSGNKDLNFLAFVDCIIDEILRV